jgi:hypothetical protein
LSRKIKHTVKVGLSNFDYGALPVPRCYSHQTSVSVGIVIDTDDTF